MFHFIITIDNIKQNLGTSRQDVPFDIFLIIMYSLSNVRIIKHPAIAASAYIKASTTRGTIIANTKTATIMMDIVFCVFLFILITSFIYIKCNFTFASYTVKTVSGYEYKYTRSFRL